MYLRDISCRNSFSNCRETATYAVAVAAFTSLNKVMIYFLYYLIDILHILQVPVIVLALLYIIKYYDTFLHFYKCIYCLILDLYMVLCFYEIRKKWASCYRHTLLLGGTVAAIRYLVINLGVTHGVTGALYDLAGIVAVALCDWPDLHISYFGSIFWFCLLISLRYLMLQHKTKQGKK